MGDEPESISEDEFAKWLPAPAAKRLVANEIGYNEAYDEIRRRLLLGSLKAAARESAWEGVTGANGTNDFEILPPKLWKVGGTPNNVANFWQTGSFDFSWRAGYQNITCLCQGIRFEPSGVDQILIDAGKRATTEEATGSVAPFNTIRRQDLPQLPDSIGQAFMAWFKTTANASKEGAEKAALHMFPNHNFSRERIRDLWGPAEMGRRKKTDN